MSSWDFIPGFSWMNVFPAAGAIAALSLKLAAVSLASRRFSSHGAWPAAWLICQAAITVYFFTLSTLKLLGTVEVWLLLIVLLVIGIVIIPKPLPIRPRTFSVALCAMLLVIAAILYRATALNDPTLDGQTYELVRLAIWMNQGSLLVTMPTTNINIFSAEWNGELVSLLYGLAAGNLQGLAFGGIEILVVLFFAMRFLLSQLRTFDASSTSLAAAMICCPACIGLAITVKGDTLAAAGIAAAMGWLLSWRREENANSLFLTISALGLAAGAKISASIPACAIAALIAWDWRAIKLKPAILGLIVATVFCARYLVNLWSFHSPFARVPAEHPVISVHTFVTNLQIIGKLWVEQYFHPPPFFTALAGGFWLIGIVGLLAIPMFRFRPLHVVAVIVGIVSILIAAAGIPPQPWSFRYFLPSTLLVLAGLLSSMALRLERPRLIDGACAIVILAQATLVSPPNDIFLEWSNIFNRRTTIERAVAFHPYLARDAMIDELHLDAEPKVIAYFSPPNRPRLIFFGSRAQNNVLLTDAASNLKTIVRQSNADIAVIGKRDPVAPAEPSQIELLEQSGCHDVHDKNWFIIASCK